MSWAFCGEKNIEWDPVFEAKNEKSIERGLFLRLKMQKVSNGERLASRFIYGSDVG
ncbi:MAG: hypothetical protein KGS72_28540 [Cyanobacteria bacterium REEB67]|nr:hypothetical protein [Cyanobacteria bacterium REEB67]